MKSAKSTAITIMSLIIIVSLLMTAASAEGLTYSFSAAPVVTARTESIAAASLTVTASGTAAGLNLEPQASDLSAGASDTAAQSDPYSDPSSVSNDTPSGSFAGIKSTMITAESVKSMVLSAGETIAAFAEQYNGYSYVYGSDSPESGFDCSGLVYYVYTHYGFTLPRTAHLQFKEGISVSKSELQPGDLVFFTTDGSGTVSHVGIYLGNNLFVHAATSNQGVIISELTNSYWESAWMGARRLVTVEAALAMAGMTA